MSQWTHVCGAIRIDGLMVNHGPAQELIKNLLRVNLPEGSEGPIHTEFTYTGYQEGNSGSVNIGTVMVSGDLRDYDDHQEILAWITRFRHLLEPHIIFRTVCVLVEVEYKKNYLIYTKMNDKYENKIKMKEL